MIKTRSTITIRGTQSSYSAGISRPTSLVRRIAARNALLGPVCTVRGARHSNGSRLLFIFRLSVSSGAGAGYLKENLTDNAGHALVQYLTHHQVEQSALVLHKEGLVVLVSGQVVESVGGPPQHVQAGPHGVWIVSQSVDPVLLGHNQRIGLGLLYEANQEADGVVLQSDGSRHAGVRLGEVEQQVDGKLSQDLIL